MLFLLSVILSVVCNIFSARDLNIGTEFLPGNLPGTVATGAVPLLWSGAGSTTSRIGGHQLSVKNPIFVDLIFCSPFLKMLIEEAWTICSCKLFHLLTTLLEKKYFRISFRQLCLEIFTEWRLMHPVVSRTKNDLNGIAVEPL